MKNKLIGLLIICFSFFYGNAQECGTRISPTYMQKVFQLMSTGTYYPQDTCLHREISIVFHIVLDSTNSPGFPLSDMSVAINSLNTYFKPLCIVFKSCSTNYISDHNYNQWVNTTHETTVFGNYYVDSTINIYLVDNIVSPSGAAGYAFMPGGPDAIVLMKASLTQLTPVHEMGHFFGLPHTFETSGGAEVVVRNNCNTTGDGFCDTEADPYPQGNTPNAAPCDYTYGPTDANGNYYTPPVDNIMTYFKACRCRFTQEQYNFMAYTYVTSRTYLH